MPAAHQEGQHLKLNRFSPTLPRIVAVFNGNQPETGEDLVSSMRRRRASPRRSPAPGRRLRPDYAPEEIAEIAQKLRKAAGLPDKVTGIIANENGGANAKGRKKAKI